MLAQKVLLDFCEKYGDAAPEDGKSTKKRGQGFSLMSYVMNTGSRQAKRQKRTRPKMDYEFFCTEMANKRKWSGAYADAEWQTFDTKDNYADDDGPPHPPFTRRLRIHTRLICGDASESEEETFQERFAWPRR